MKQFTSFTANQTVNTPTVLSNLQKHITYKNRSTDLFWDYEKDMSVHTVSRAHKIGLGLVDNLNLANFYVGIAKTYWVCDFDFNVYRVWFEWSDYYNNKILLAFYEKVEGEVTEFVDVSTVYPITPNPNGFGTIVKIGDNTYPSTYHEELNNIGPTNSEFSYNFSYDEYNALFDARQVKRDEKIAHYKKYETMYNDWKIDAVSINNRLPKDVPFSFGVVYEKLTADGNTQKAYF
jgi:hypothetical protein